MKLSRFKSLVVFVLCLLPVSAPADTLDDLAGVWTGAGSMKPSDGPRERIRCKATYTVQKPNRSMDLDLLCAPVRPTN